MKGKILELIHKELENIGNENIFFSKNCGSYYPTKPVKNKTIYIEREYNENDWLETNSVNERVEYLDYCLTFEDGEPPIEVCYSVTPVFIESIQQFRGIWPFKFKTKISTHYYNIVRESKITCGKYTFVLTEDEEEDLLERTKFAYQCFSLTREKHCEDEIMAKLTLRLDKWKK